MSVIPFSTTFRAFASRTFPYPKKQIFDKNFSLYQLYCFKEFGISYEVFAVSKNKTNTIMITVDDDD